MDPTFRGRGNGLFTPTHPPQPYTVVVVVVYYPLRLKELWACPGTRLLEVEVLGNGLCGPPPPSALQCGGGHPPPKSRVPKKFQSFDLFPNMNDRRGSVRSLSECEKEA